MLCFVACAMEMIVKIGKIVEPHAHRDRLLVNPAADVLLEDFGLKDLNPAGRAVGEHLEHHDQAQESRWPEQRTHRGPCCIASHPAPRHRQQSIDKTFRQIDRDDGQQPLRE